VETSITKAKSPKFNIVFVATALLIYLFSSTGNGFAATTSTDAVDEKVRKNVNKSYWRLPLRFEANQGQTDSRVKFVSRGLGYNLFLTQEEAVFSLESGEALLFKGNSQSRSHSQTNRRTTVFSIQFMGSNSSVQPKGVEELPIKTSYLIGNDPLNWRRDIPTYAKVEAKELYSDIDLLYYGKQRQLEFDFVVRPGGDYKSIRMKFKNVHELRKDSEGNLALSVDGGKVLLEKPIIYQLVSGKKHHIPGCYVLQTKKMVGFQVASYDPKIPLVIDPVLNYSTYLGGSSDDFGNGIAVDTFGNAYIIGSTSSNDYPMENPIQGGRVDLNDVFISKFNSDGSSLVYSTYLGGDSEDFGNDIALDSSGNAYITGSTQSTDFPTTGSAFQTSPSSLIDAFVAKINSDGSSLVYSTYLGGAGGDDRGNGIAIDSSGDAYVTGLTQSSSFPTQDPLQPVRGSAQDAFITKLNSDGSALVYSTYLGGDNNDFGNDIAVDSSNNVYVVGTTLSNNFPRQDPLQPVRGSIQDAFITKLNSDGSALVYSTYLGGNSDDFGNGIAVDSLGNSYVTGATQSTDFPTQDPLQTTLLSIQDAFVTKLNADGSALIYSTYLGGDDIDLGNDIAVDTSGNAYITGTTQSNDFPTEDAFQSARSSLRDAFVGKINPSGEAILYSTYIGGASDDLSNSIAMDTAGNAYIAGTTASVDFPVTTGAFEETQQGAQDAFVSKLGPFGDTFIYSTYLGGTGDDFGNGIAVDTSGSAYVTGTTDSNDFPTQNPIQAANAGLNDTFVSKLSSDGSALDYSTYLGGSGDDLGNDITLDTSGNAYVTGTTGSNDFPTQAPIQAANAGSNDAFVTKLNSAGTILTYSTYLGGSMDDAGNSIALDTSGNAYVAGTTGSNDFPTQAPIQAANAGLNDTFVTKFNSAGSALTYSTYLGGSMDDLGNGIAVDISGNAYITGTTESDNFPTRDAFQANRGGGKDGFISKIDAVGNTLLFSSYLGGNLDDFGNDVAIDGLVNAFVAGSTLSSDFPTKSVQDTPGGGNDGFVTKIQEAEGSDGTTGGGTEGGGGGASCFIGSAAYGTLVSPQGPLNVLMATILVVFISIVILSIALGLSRKVGCPQTALDMQN
jgi:hypothetical protein